MFCELGLPALWRTLFVMTMSCVGGWEGKEGEKEEGREKEGLEQDPTSQGFQYPHTGPLSWEPSTQTCDPVGTFCVLTRKSWVLVITLQKENSKEKGEK